MEARFLELAAKSYQGVLGPGDRLSSVESGNVYVYRWVPNYADPLIRSGDYVLLDPDEGRHYGGRNGKRLTARVPTSRLEYRQGDEFVYRGPSLAADPAEADGAVVTGPIDREAEKAWASAVKILTAAGHDVDDIVSQAATVVQEHRANPAPLDDLDPEIQSAGG